MLMLLWKTNISGSDKERGVDEDRLPHEDDLTSRAYLYDLPLIARLQRKYKVLRHVPFFQPYVTSFENKSWGYC